MREIQIRNEMPVRLFFVILSLGLFIASCNASYKVSIRSDPSGAEVRDLSKGRLGETDLTLAVQGEEPLNLTFSKEGYEEEKYTVPEVTHDQTVMVNLRPKNPTLLLVETIPPGAGLRLLRPDGTRVDLPDASLVSGKLYAANCTYAVPPDLKEARIELFADGFKPQRASVSIDPNKTNRFTFTLERLELRLGIQTEPVDGAEIFERRLGYLGRSPLQITLDWKQIKRIAPTWLKDGSTRLNLHLSAEKAGYETTELVHPVCLGAPDGPALITIRLVEKGNSDRSRYGDQTPLHVK